MTGFSHRVSRQKYDRRPFTGFGAHRPMSVFLRYLLLIVICVAGTILVVSASAQAQLPDETESPSATASIEPARLQLEAGKAVNFAVKIVPPPGHHAYLDAGKDGALLPIEINLDALRQAGLQALPAGKPKGTWDEQIGATVLRGEGTFRYQLTARPEVKAGTRNFVITVRSQVCNDTNGACYFPHVETLHLQVDVRRAPAGSVGGGVVGGATSGQIPADSTGTADPAIDFSRYTPRTSQPAHNLLVWMLLAFVAGLAMNIMPCVLPVVSIKVLSFVQQAGESRRRVLTMGLFFAAGILTVFLALAGAAILFGLGWGQQFQSQAFLITMIALVFAFALSLFGLYEFGVPGTLNSLAANTTREGFGSAYLKGALATLLATPCSGPLLGSTLAWTLTQPPAIVLLIFGMLGFGMALPYVVLTAHPALLNRLPKPGPWMETFKHIMGFLLVGTVVYLMVSLDQQLLLFTVMLLVFVAIGAWVWGRFSLHPRSAVGRVMVLASAVLIMGMGAYFSFHTVRGILHPPSAMAATSLSWEPFDPVMLDQYQREGRSVMLDFTADWCANCTFNEVHVYNSATVRQLLREKNVVTMKADLTREGPSTRIIRQLMAQLGARSIPFLAVFPGDQPTKPYTLYDLVEMKTVSKLLKRLPNPGNNET